MNTLAFNNQASDFEKDLSIAFASIWDYVPEDNSTNWTKAVNNILDNIVRKIRPNLKVAACKLDSADCSEWLYDFVCYENNTIGLKDVVLVAESEWKNIRYNDDYLQDIQDDFEKLLLARCPYKLMIFEGDDEDEIKAAISHLQAIIQNCNLTSKDDRYMFAGWINAKEFYFDLYIQN